MFKYSTQSKIRGTMSQFNCNNTRATVSQIIRMFKKSTQIRINHANITARVSQSVG